MSGGLGEGRGRGAGRGTYLGDAGVEVEVDEAGHDELVGAVDGGGGDGGSEVFFALKHVDDAAVLDDQGGWIQERVFVIQSQDGAVADDDSRHVCASGIALGRRVEVVRCSDLMQMIAVG